MSTITLVMYSCMITLLRTRVRVLQKYSYSSTSTITPSLVATHYVNKTFDFCFSVLVKSSYIAQYPVLRTIQSVLHFTSLTDLFTQTPSRLLWEASSHMLQLMCEGCSYTYPPLSIARYSFIQLSELEQGRVKKLARGFNTATQDSNTGSRSRESEALPLSHCALLPESAI